MRSLDDVAELIAFFEARQGQLHAFRWKDWSDYKSCLPSREVAFDDQVIGLGDDAATRFQLRKHYASGPFSAERIIAKPVAGTVRVGLQGDMLTEGVHFSVDTATGILTFATAPAWGETVTAGFEFDVPVRFDTEAIRVSVASFQAGDVPQVPIVEVRI
jgi:uncharacterized protein (TIGR02217 family)